MAEKPFPYGEGLNGNQRKNCAIARNHLSNTSHTLSMDLEKPKRSVWILLAALMVSAWALIIWIATEVTRTALETLQYIVDLAQYTP